MPRTVTPRQRSERTALAAVLALALGVCACNTRLPSQGFDAAHCALTLTTPVTLTGSDGTPRALTLEGCSADWNRDTQVLVIALFPGSNPGNPRQPVRGTLTLTLDGTAPANSTLAVRSPLPGSLSDGVVPRSEAMLSYLPIAGGEALTGDGTLPIGDDFVGLAAGPGSAPTVRFDANLGDVRLSDGSRLAGRFALVASN